MDKNKFDENAPIQVIRVENGYKIIEGVTNNTFYRDEHGRYSSAEYVFSDLESAFGFISRHFNN